MLCTMGARSISNIWIDGKPYEVGEDGDTLVPASVEPIPQRLLDVCNEMRALLEACDQTKEFLEWRALYGIETKAPSA